MNGMKNATLERVKRMMMLSAFLLIAGMGTAGAGGGGDSQKSPEPAQNRTRITGTVVDRTGEPVIGANIVEKGAAANGTVSDTDGKFSLNVADNAVLQVSYIGYVTQEISVGRQTALHITLAEDMQALEEVVVVGYGTVKKSDLTGSISSISSKSFLDMPNSSVNNILAGRAPGVAVRRSNGAPGEGSTLRIRGTNSLMGNNDPLIVVDGNYGGLPDMNDIASIEILKDASATAIYGSRGANGVILVTTKRGSYENKPTVQIISNVSVDRLPGKWGLMDADEFAEYNKSIDRIGENDLAWYREHGGVDWQDELFRTGLSQNYKAILTGGSKNLRYYLSPSYRNTAGIMRGTEAGGYGYTAKVDMHLNDRVSIQMESNLGHSSNLNPGLGQDGGNTNSAILSALMWAPTERMFEDDGTYRRLGYGSGSAINPLLLTTDQNTSYGNSGNVIGNLRVKIMEGFYFDGKASYAISTGGNRRFINEKLNGGTADASQSGYESKSWLVNAYLTYNKTFARRHNLTAMAGFEESKDESQSFSGSAKDLAIKTAGWYNLELGATREASSSYSNSALRSFFGRLNYDYASKYLATATWRADGSSKFRGDKQFSYFPSFSLAWRLSEEPFLKNADIFQNLKIRGGWGITGSQAVDSYATYAYLRRRRFAWEGNNDEIGYGPQIGGNPDLQWEETKQWDLGLDVSVWDGRLSLTVDYYSKHTDKLLAPVTAPAYNGADPEHSTTSTTANLGVVENRGIEASLNFAVFTNANCSYEINLNGSFNRNRVLDIGEQNILYGETYAPGTFSQSPFATMPGYPVGNIYGIKYLGIWQESEAAQAAEYNLQPGDYKYEDVDGDKAYDADDFQSIGCANPKFTWGFNNHFSWKNFDFNALFEGVAGRSVINWTYLKITTSSSGIVTHPDGKDKWTPSNPSAKFARLNNTNLQGLSDQWIQDASYVKLRNISVAYRFPRKMIPFANVKVSVSAQNYLTLTKYMGYDPEVSTTSGKDVSASMDWFAYPNPKSISFGLSVEY
jgi:TonB-linked SusC/RagA family outer membrane protein